MAALKKKVAPKVPRSAVVDVSCPDGQQAAFMKAARKKISLAKLRIENPLKARKALTDAVIIEIQVRTMGSRWTHWRAAYKRWRWSGRRAS